MTDASGREVAWKPVGERQRLRGRTIEIWRLKLDELTSKQRGRLVEFAAPDERKRARRFRFDADRHRHLAGRGLLRVFLSEELGGDPTTHELIEGPYEKPHLEEGAGGGTDYQFNVAHAGDFVLAAFRPGSPVGIDVEPLERTDGADGVAERVLTDREYKNWKAVPAERRARFFMRVWTCKEALIKATGEGLQRPPETIECSFERERPVAMNKLEQTATDIDGGGPGEWAVHSFDLDGEAAAAIAWRIDDDNPPDICYFDATDALKNRMRACPGQSTDAT